MTSSDDPILSSWQANAQQWIATIDGQELESRKLTTNQAIVEIILKYSPRTVLDVGCGEGWLSRTLNEQGIHTWGVDAIPELISNARMKGTDTYKVMSYQQLIEGASLMSSPFDGAVINFALLDKDTTEQLIPALSRYLSKHGYLFIQTLHPYMVANAPYRSGWREGSWDGMKRTFTHPYKWYFRTLEDWVNLFIRSGYALQEIREPYHPKTGQPASVIFVLQQGRA